MAIDLKKIIAQKEVENFISYLEKTIGQAVVSEHRFDPSRRWRFDFAIPAHKIAIEVEGGVFTQGRHTRGKGYINDLEKYNRATELGWCLIRITPNQKYSEKFIEQLRSMVRNRKNELLCRY
jgi:very-short-patch-repair endonuclease